MATTKAVSDNIANRSKLSLGTGRSVSIIEIHKEWIAWTDAILVHILST